MKITTFRPVYLMGLPVILLILLSFSRPSEPRSRILVFSKTDGFRHTSIEAGKAAFKKMADEKGFDVDFTEDGNQFVTNNLKRYSAVVWLNTTGDVLNIEQQN